MTRSIPLATGTAPTKFGCGPYCAISTRRTDGRLLRPDEYLVRSNQNDRRRNSSRKRCDTVSRATTHLCHGEHCAKAVSDDDYSDGACTSTRYLASTGAGLRAATATIFLMLLKFAPMAASWTVPLIDDLAMDRRTAIFRASARAGATLGTAFVPLRTEIAFAESSAGRSIFGRLESDILVMPPPSRSSELNGVDNLYYPEFLEGEWAVTQTLVNASTPLGLKFVGGPSGSVDIASASMAEVRKKLNVPVSLRLRYVRTKWGVAEDRLFNTKQRLDAFAGRSVVSSVEYADVGGSNRASVVALGGTEDDPLQTTVVRFKGPAAQKTFVVAHGSEPSGAGAGGDGWAGFELDRSIFALTNRNTAPPVTTDTELVWSFQRGGGGDRVIGRLRIASFLNAQSDSLYFEARNRAVSLQDYDLDMVKL